MKISVIIPAYNEAGTLGATIREIRAAFENMPEHECEIVVVDDASTDAPPEDYTADADQFVLHKRNMGYGAALKSGFRAATGETLVIIDADGTYPPQAIPELLAALDAGADMAVGRRKLLPGRDEGAVTPFIILRAVAKALLSLLADYLAGQNIPDLNSGLRAFRNSELQKFIRLLPDGFSLTTTITLAYLCNGLRIEYIPIQYKDRPADQPSKIQPVRDTGRILLTILRTIVFFNPLKVCIPLALLIWALGLLVLFVSAATGRIMDGTVAVCAMSGLQLIVLGLLADALARRNSLD